MTIVVITALLPLETIRDAASEFHDGFLPEAPLPATLLDGMVGNALCVHLELMAVDIGFRSNFSNHPDYRWFETD